jgi:hypothetical protein
MDGDGSTDFHIEDKSSINTFYIQRNLPGIEPKVNECFMKLNLRFHAPSTHTFISVTNIAYDLRAYETSLSFDLSGYVTLLSPDVPEFEGKRYGDSRVIFTEMLKVEVSDDQDFSNILTTLDFDPGWCGWLGKW